ncbi:hypothetical protein [Aeromicrobium choanae]|uniref:hypothetical protein n=1 Tax=Aeromicrobium choanae TaxID=1736691 RepID=UPI0012946BA0|nr:hypothetical protein [Aeromicrobium choanae]
MISLVANGTSLTDALRTLVPLRIQAVEFNNGTLVLIGERWSLAVVGEWMWIREGVLETDWSQAGAEDTVWNLCGVHLLGAEFSDPVFAGDCSFRLSDGTLEIRSDRTGWETWTFRHEVLGIIYVGC